jgi:non-heme chloroperoxidase
MNETTSLMKAVLRGAEICYQIMGDGEPLIFVHGSLGDYRSWSLQAPVFARSFQVVSYSRRYHHPNSWTGDGLDYSAALHADDLSALMDHLGLDQAHLVSASYGSYCALIFALRHPKRVSSLVVGEPPMLDWLRRLEGGEELVRPFIERALIPCREAFIRGEDEKAVRLFIDGVVGRQGAFDSFHPPIRRSLMDNAREMKAECLSDRLFPGFSCKDASHIPVPTLLLSGEGSPAFFRRITQELQNCLPASEECVLPGVSHNLNSARPRLYNRVVMDFLLRHSTQPNSASTVSRES